MQNVTIDPENRDEVLRQLLKNEFQKRSQKNPAFSLRAFAQKLEIDQSLLSKFLQGKRKFSKDATNKVTQFLGIYIDKLPDPTTNPSAGSEISYELLKEDEFYILSTWYHFAILELAKTKDFKATVPHIAQRLGISELETQQALERLERFGFIEIKKDKFVLKKPSNHWLNFAATTAAKKSMQKKLHEMATEAIEDIPFELREHSGLTVAVDPKLIPEIKKKMMQFRRSLDKWIVENGSEKEVYHLCVSFFPLTKIKDRN